MSRPSSKALRYKEEGCDAFKFRCGTDWEHSDIFNDPLTVSDGVMALSERPGFGMELIDDVEREVPLRTGWVQSAQPPSIALKSDERPTSPRSTSQSSRSPGRSRGLRPCLAIERISVAGGQAVTGERCPRRPVRDYTCFTKVIQSGLSPTSWVSSGCSDPLAVSIR